MCTEWLSHAKWLSQQSNKSASNVTLSLTFLHGNYSHDSEGHSYGQLVIDSFMMTTLARSGISSNAELFGETSNHPGDSAPLQPRFGALKLLAFPKTKITFEREEISDCWWDSGKYDRQLMVIGRTVWGPKGPTLKGTEVSLSCVQCFLSLLSSSINVSIFHITWLDTFWTDLLR